MPLGPESVYRKYRKYHCGDKTILRPSYLRNGISFTGKMISLCWIRSQAVCIPFCIETCRSWLICVSDWMTYGGYLTTDMKLYVNSVLGLLHDDVIKWKHFLQYWPFVWSPVNSPQKGQWRGALMFSLICTWINGWVNNREPGDLRCHCTHYDVTVTWSHIYHIFVVNIQHQSSWILWAQNIKTARVTDSNQIDSTNIEIFPLYFHFGVV